ncbi:MAG: endonuclease NucS [Pyrobaculum sp.]
MSSLQDAVRVINGGKKEGVVVVVGTCEVWYAGRASARLKKGRRLVLIKKDGTLLVHEAEKAQPKVWNPPGSSTAAYVEGGTLVLKSVRQRPFETVRVVFHDVEFVGVFKMGSTELELVGSERDVVEILANAPWLVEEGLVVLGVEVPTDVGHVDILARDREGRQVVIEVKRDVASHDAVFQLARYVESLRRRGVEARGVLVAADITTTAAEYLRRYGLEFIKINPRDLYLDVLS